jgi:hypothetical protein
MPSSVIPTDRISTATVFDPSDNNFTVSKFKEIVSSDERPSECSNSVDSRIPTRHILTGSYAMVVKDVKTLANFAHQLK